MIRILAFSGSLRAASSNTSILHSIVKFAPANVEIRIYAGLAGLPHFSPEIDGDDSPATVKDLRTLISEADGVIISTPEYAFGVPGTLKNALDWTVSSGELNEKPVSAISASPSNFGGDKALASLLLTLTALGTIQASTLSIPIIYKKLNEKKEVSDPGTLVDLRHLLDELLKAIEEKRKLKG
jgi:chromate reductase, NAD(P)H dehydrogenase (quinone)